MRFLSGRGSLIARWGLSAWPLVALYFVIGVLVAGAWWAIVVVAAVILFNLVLSAVIRRRLVVFPAALLSVRHVAMLSGDFVHLGMLLARHSRSDLRRLIALVIELSDDRYTMIVAAALVDAQNTFLPSTVAAEPGSIHETLSGWGTRGWRHHRRAMRQWRGLTERERQVVLYELFMIVGTADDEPAVFVVKENPNGRPYTKGTSLHADR